MSDRLKARPSLTLVRRYKAPVEKVFAAFTNPEKIRAWWGPAPSDVTYLAEADLRIGGAFRVAFRTVDGDDHEVRGIYREIETNKRLVFSWAWRTTPERESQVTLTFAPMGAETELTLLHENFFDEEARNNHNRGWEGAFEKLKTHLEGLQPTRFESLPARTFVGVKQRFTGATMNDIPALWAAFGSKMGAIPGARGGGVCFGIVTSMTPEPFAFDYIACVETDPSAAPPDGMTRLDLPAHAYAVFDSEAPITKIRELMDAVWQDWLPSSGREMSGAVMERYEADFDHTKPGRWGVWVPLKA